jgi:hypothetical protein
MGAQSVSQAIDKRDALFEPLHGRARQTSIRSVRAVATAVSTFASVVDTAAVSATEMGECRENCVTRLRVDVGYLSLPVAYVVQQTDASLRPRRIPQRTASHAGRSL